MDSSGSLERTSRLRFAAQTPARVPSPEDYGDGVADRPERSAAAAYSRSSRSERNTGSVAEGRQSVQIVLLIEDNPAVVTTVSDCLRDAGYELWCAASVEDAVQKVASRPIALVLLNWGLLTRIGGGELVGQLRTSSARARLPMVAISDNVSALNEASSLGIEDYLLDPFHLEDLLHVVDEHCC